MSELLPHLDGTNTVAIITTRRDGRSVATPIWSVVADGVGYVRSVYGPDAAWYRRALSGRPVAFSLENGKIAERDPDESLATPNVPVTVTAIAADDPIERVVDDALRAKYGRERASLAAMLAPLASGCTLRVDTA